MHGPGQIHNLRRIAGTDQRGCDARVAQHPGHCHLRQRLTACLGDVVERAHVAQVLRAQVLGRERAAAGPVDARIYRHAVQVFVAQQPLGQRAKGNAAHAGIGQGVEQVFFNPAVHQAVRRLVDQRLHAHAFEDGMRLARFASRIAAYAHVQRLALLHRTGQRAHGFFQRGVRVKAVAVKNIDVVQAHALQALVQAGEHVFARAAALAVGPGPHVPAGFAGNDEFVPVGPKVAFEVFAKITFSAAIGRAVVVGQVKVGDAQIKGGAQHVALGLQRRGVAKVVPQAQGQSGQFQAALAAAAVGHAALVAVGVGVVVHRQKNLKMGRRNRTVP